MAATTLLGAAQRGDLALVKKFLSEGKPVNKRQKSSRWYPLGGAVDGGHYAVVKALVRAGARLNLQSTFGWTPVFTAVKRGHYRIAYLLLKNGALPTVPTKGGYASTQGDSALHIAAKRGKMRVLKALVKAGAKDSPMRGAWGIQGVVDTALEYGKYRSACYLLMNGFKNRNSKIQRVYEQII